MKYLTILIIGILAMAFLGCAEKTYEVKDTTTTDDTVEEVAEEIEQVDIEDDLAEMDALLADIEDLDI